MFGTVINISGPTGQRVNPQLYTHTQTPTAQCVMNAPSFFFYEHALLHPLKRKTMRVESGFKLRQENHRQSIVGRNGSPALILNQ